MKHLLDTAPLARSAAALGLALILALNAGCAALERPMHDFGVPVFSTGQ